MNRFIDVFTVEYGTCLAAGLLAEYHLFRREWVLASSTVDFLRRFVLFPRSQVRVSSEMQIPLDFGGVYSRACAVRRVQERLLGKRVDAATEVIATFGSREEGSDVYRPESDASQRGRVARLPPRQPRSR